jgi:hypothetical protein
LQQHSPSATAASTPSAAAGGYPDQRLHRSLVVCQLGRIQQQRGPVNPPETFMGFIDLGAYAQYRK